MATFSKQPSPYYKSLVTWKFLDGTTLVTHIQNTYSSANREGTGSSTSAFVKKDQQRIYFLRQSGLDQELKETRPDCSTSSTQQKEKWDITFAPSRHCTAQEPGNEQVWLMRTPSHPTHYSFKVTPSWKRLGAIRTKTTRHSKSFSLLLFQSSKYHACTVDIL